MLVYKVYGQYTMDSIHGCKWTELQIWKACSYNYTADYSSFNLLELQNTNYENDFRILDSRQSHNARKCFLAKFVKIRQHSLNKMKSESCSDKCVDTLHVTSCNKFLIISGML